jgi:hypothetical protein
MFICGAPKDSAEFSRVWEVEQKLFGTLSVRPSVAHEIYKARPELFAAIFSQDQTAAAYSVVYPLRPRYAQALIDGDISEPDITPDMLLTYEDSHEDACIYVGSVVVDESYDSLTRASLLAGLVSWRAAQMRRASIKRVSLIMTGVSKSGEKLIRYVGAKQLKDAESRSDGYAMWGRSITPGYLYRITVMVERYFNGRIVKMRSAPVVPSRAVPRTTEPQLA